MESLRRAAVGKSLL